MTKFDTSKPIETSLQTIRPEWCDMNGHMNVAYYSLAFENASFEAQELMGLGETYLREQLCSLFTLKNIFTYQQEVVEGDPVRITYGILDYGPKLLHVLLEMYHGPDGFLSCFTEQLVAHVDMETRRTSPMSQTTLDMLEEMKRAQAGLPLPRGIGEAIRIVKK